MSKSHRQKADAKDLGQVQDTATVHHESTKKKRAKPRGVSQLQLTSMMDVVFQLLIFFILTANFAIDEGVLPADLPQGTPPVPQDVEPPPDPRVILLNASGIDGVSIQIKGTSSLFGDDFEQLYTLLAGWQASGLYEPDFPIVIQPGNDVQWGYVVNAFNAAVRAKYTNVSFAQASGVR